MRWRPLVTLGLAVLLGIAAAWWGVPLWQAHRALQAISQEEPSARVPGWGWMLEGRDRPAGPRAARFLDRIVATLESGPDAALLDGAAALRGCHLWDWQHVPRGLVLREVALRAASDATSDQVVAARQMGQCPLQEQWSTIRPIFDRLMASTAPRVRRLAIEAACAWLGRERVHLLGTFELPADDIELRRFALLARSWGTRHVEPAEPRPGEPPDLIEARLLYATRLWPDDASVVLARLVEADAQTRPALEYMLRHSRDPRAVELVGDSAQIGGGPDALPSSGDEDRLGRMLGDDGYEAWMRRLIAWRWGGADEEAVWSLLTAADPADPDGSVYAAVLLAERDLPPPRAAALAESWIRDLHDNRKRAGAHLAGLLGRHEGLLARAFDGEDMPAVRKAQRLALTVMGRSVGQGDPVEFAYRALYQPDGDFDPDTALCFLATGHREALKLLTSAPRGDAAAYGRGVRRRAWLIERFVPGWHGAAGWPPTEARAVRLHFESLRALGVLSARRLEFDPPTRTLGISGSGRAPAFGTTCP